MGIAPTKATIYNRFATDGRSCRPLRGGSRRGAMRSDAFPFLTVSIIPKATAFRERLWASVVAGFPFLCALCVLCGENTLRSRAHLLHPPKLQNSPQRKQYNAAAVETSGAEAAAVAQATFSTVGVKSFSRVERVERAD